MSNSNEAKRDKIGNWFAGSFQWRIPVYQRHYAWDAALESGPIHLFWGTVKEQTEKRLKGEEPNQHYLGAVLVDHKSDRGAALDGVTIYDVVDGQQRLTTIQVALLALIKVADKFDCGSEVKKSLMNYMLDGENPKLKPTNFDREQFKAVLYNVYRIVMDFAHGDNVTEENAKRSKIWANFEFFAGKFEKFVKNHESGDVKKAIHAIKDTLIHGFDIVVIILNETDDAQRVFESLNSYAKPLTTFDLIRNNIFHRADEDAEEIFNLSLWQKLEDPYWEERGSGQNNNPTPHIETYIARMLVSKRPNVDFLFNRSEIFETYKSFSRTFESIHEEVKELSCYTQVYQYLAGREGIHNPISPEFDFGVFFYKIWNSRDFYPVIFSIVGSEVSIEEKQRMIKLLESYVIRRSVSSPLDAGSTAALTTNRYNLQAVTLCRALEQNPNYKGLNDAIKRDRANTTVFPDDNRVKSDCYTTKFYKSPFMRYVFDRIEDSLHDVDVEKVVVGEGQLTIDHILPQGWEANEQWKDIVLGAGENRNDAAQLSVATYIHTIGNLTLVSGANNTRMSNRSFEERKEWLTQSGLKINRNLAGEESWNIDKIVARSKWLGEKICEIWPYDIE